LGRKSEHGLKLIIARATAGDAIWFKAAIDRIADILARQGDTDTSRYAAPRRSRLSPNPAEALRLLYAHQDDQWDGSREPDDCEPAEEDANDPEQPADSENDDDAVPGPGADVNAETGSVDDEPSASQADASEEAAHRSLQITPPPFHPDRARPRAIIYVHFSVEALTAGTGICRAENIGPILLTRLPSQNLRRLATLPTRTRQLALALTPRLDSPRQRHRHPPPRQHLLRPRNLARRHKPTRDFPG